MRLIYVAGVPGAGKTTAMEALLEGREAIELRKPFAHCWYPEERWTVLGPAGRPPFGGTDRLGMGVQPTVIAWLAGECPGTVIGEGDRLANLKFLRAAAETGYETLLVHLSCDPATAVERRSRRAAEHGLGPQNASWLAGRHTKVERLVTAWEAEGTVVTLDGEAPPASIAARLAGIVCGEPVDNTV